MLVWLLDTLQVSATMFVVGGALLGGFLAMQGLIKCVTVAIVKHKFKKKMKGE